MAVDPVRLGGSIGGGFTEMCCETPRLPDRRREEEEGKVEGRRRRLDAEAQDAKDHQEGSDKCRHEKSGRIRG